MDEKARTEPAHEGDERAVLTGFLEYQRETLAIKCAGLSAGQLRARAVEPSGLSLLGLVRHMADVERGWFRQILNGEDCPDRWPRDGERYTDFDVEDADPQEAFDAWQEECALSRAVVDEVESLGVTGRDGDDVFSARWIITHMIEEYARHNGHADLLRERIDGVTGE